MAWRRKMLTADGEKREDNRMSTEAGFDIRWCYCRTEGGILKRRIYRHRAFASTNAPGARAKNARDREKEAEPTWAIPSRQGLRSSEAIGDRPMRRTANPPRNEVL